MRIVHVPADHVYLCDALTKEVCLQCGDYAEECFCASGGWPPGWEEWGEMADTGTPNAAIKG